VRADNWLREVKCDAEDSPARERERERRERERFELGTVDMLSIGGMTFVLGVLCVACLVIISGLPSKIHRTKALAILTV